MEQPRPYARVLSPASTVCEAAGSRKRESARHNQPQADLYLSRYWGSEGVLVRLGNPPHLHKFMSCNVECLTASMWNV